MVFFGAICNIRKLTASKRIDCKILLPTKFAVNSLDILVDSKIVGDDEIQTQANSDQHDSDSEAEAGNIYSIAGIGTAFQATRTYLATVDVPTTLQQISIRHNRLIISYLILYFLNKERKAAAFNIYSIYVFILIVFNIDMDLNSLDKRQKLTIKDENMKASLLPPSFLSSNSTHLGSQVSSSESKQIANAHENKNQGSASNPIDIAKTELGASHSQSIFIRKEREKENDQNISKQWKNARKIFFTKQITQKLIEDKIEEDQHKGIIQMFLNEQGRIKQHSLSKLISILSKEKGLQTDNEKHKVIFFNLQVLRKHYKLMQSLKKQLQAIENAFEQKQRECFPLVQIIKQKITSLKTIHIEYQTKLNNALLQEYTYFISAFEFFKLIHENHLLTKVTVKGVFIQKFQQFINSTSQTIEDQELCWINEFSPSKSLQLTINTNITFNVDQTNETFSCMSDLAFFIGLFGFVSDIRVKINLSEWKHISQSVEVVKSIWDQLRKIRNIKLQIWGKNYTNYCPIQSVMIARSVIFGQLSSFTEIVSLSFFCIELSSCFAEFNIFLAMEESLAVIFENNHITSFRIGNCSYFPVIPKTESLELFYFFYAPFRKDISCMPNVVRTNFNLNFIKLQWGFQEWKIDQKLMNQVQTLIVQYCDAIILTNISPQSISKLKYLRIFSCNIEDEQFLSITFPKFANLTRLELSYVSFRHELLCLLSSPSLQKLTIQNNNIITDQGLQVIDSKWPYIKFIRLCKYSFKQENAWSICKFKGLIEFQCDQPILNKGKAAFLSLKRQGVNIQYITD